MNFLISALFGMVFLLPLVVSGQNCQLKVEGDVKEPSCKGGMDAAISLQISGGTPPYTYSWHSGHDGATIKQLTAGTYRVTVQDSEGCRSNAVFTLKAAEKELGLQVEQQQTADGKVLQVIFKGNLKPAAIYIKDMSKGFRAPQTAYNGQVLKSGTYLLEAFTDEGCSVLQQLIIEAN
jgi:hypothetical protein